MGKSNAVLLNSILVLELQFQPTGETPSRAEPSRPRLVSKGDVLTLTMDNLKTMAILPSFISRA